MSREKYQRYEARYNSSTVPVAINSNRPWTVAEEARLLKTWCRAAASPAARIHVRQGPRQDVRGVRQATRSLPPSSRQLDRLQG